MALPTAEDLGYGDTMPTSDDLGYGDLGYGEAIPSSASLDYEEEEEEYEDSVSMPSVASLGYEDYSSMSHSHTSRRSSNSMPTHEDLGYGCPMEPKQRVAQRKTSRAPPARTSSRDFAPALPSRRGSEEGASGYQSDDQQPKHKPVRKYDIANDVAPAQPMRGGRRRAAGRRSSVAGACTMATAAPTPLQTKRRQMRRRITMDHVQPAELSKPSHYTMAPRRSSMKTSLSFHDEDQPMTPTSRHSDPSVITTFQQKASRRVSFGSSATVSHVEPLHQTEQEKKDLYYDSQELGRLRRNVKKMVQDAHAKPLDATEETWRGLESYIKRAKEGNARSVSESELCNQIMLQLKHKQAKQEAAAAARANRLSQSSSSKQRRDRSTSTTSRTSSTSSLSGDGSEDDNSSYSEDDSNSDYSDSDSDSDEELLMDLQLSAKRMLRRASRNGMKLADRDAAEARAIYMESMPQDQVQAYFSESPTTQRRSSSRRGGRPDRRLLPGSYRASVA